VNITTEDVETFRVGQGRESAPIRCEQEKRHHPSEEIALGYICDELWVRFVILREHGLRAQVNNISFELSLNDIK
jgi:hypothetical protein